MASGDKSLSISFDYESGKSKIEKDRSSEFSDKLACSFELDDISEKRMRNALDLVDEDNEKNILVLNNFLKKQYRYDSEEESMILNVFLPPLTCSTIIFSIVGWIWISTSICLSKYVYFYDILSIWEDIYGRAIVGLIISYFVVLINRAPLWDNPPSIRFRLFLMQIIFVAAIILIMMTLNQLPAVEVTAILLNFYVFQQKIFLLFSLFGLIILSNPINIFDPNVDGIFPVIWMVIALFLLIMGKVISRQIKQSIYLSTEMFLFNFSCLVIIPILMMAVFTMESLQLKYGMLEIWYLVVNGFVTWLGIYLFVISFNRDKRKLLEIVAYLSLILTGFCEYFLNYTPKQIDEIINTDVLNPGDTSTPRQVGLWTYVGIAWMLILRFLFWLYKVFQAGKRRNSSVYSDYFLTNFID